MNNILLPRTHRRAMLRSFWLIICVCTAAVTAVVSWTMAWPSPIGIALFAGVLLASLVFFQENLVWLCYRGWNLFVKGFAAISRELVTRLCYFIIFVAVGRAGSRISLTSSAANASFWKPESSGEMFDRDSSITESEAARRFGWVHDYLQWAIRSGNVWTVVLLPFLAILRACSNPQGEAKELNIYTLF